MNELYRLNDGYPRSEVFDEILPMIRTVGGIALSYQHKSDSVEHKLDGSPVTYADKAIEEYVFNRLGKILPDDGFQGEEGFLRDSKNGRLWTLDPIDGTIQFIHGQEFWATLLALDDTDITTTGFITFPARNELIFAEINKGCWEISNNKINKLQASSVSSLPEAYVLHNGIDFAKKANRLDQLSKIVLSAYAERGYADAFGHAEIMRGHADVMIDFLTEYHDIAAVKIGIAESGGTWTAIDGTQDLSNGSGGSITSNGKLHQTIVEALR